MNLEGIRVWKFVEPNQQVEVFGAEAEDLVFKKYAIEFRRAAVEPGKKGYRLVELREKRGNASLITNVVDGKGDPRANIDVAFYWPTAPDPPDPATPIYSTDWYPNFVHGPTNMNGDVGPGMGRGAYYGAYPAPGDKHGPHAVWVRDPNIPSDIVEKLGMLAMTPHDHLDQKFERRVEPGAGPQPEPEPPEEEPTMEWKMTVIRQDKLGTRLLVGSLPQPDVVVSLVSPWGRTINTLSGSKPEYGTGGFEFNIWTAGDYAVRFLDQSFPITVTDNVIVTVTFTQAGELPLPEPEPPSGDEELAELYAAMKEILARMQAICEAMRKLLGI